MTSESVRWAVDGGGTLADGVRDAPLADLESGTSCWWPEHLWPRNWRGWWQLPYSPTLFMHGGHPRCRAFGTMSDRAYDMAHRPAGRLSTAGGRSHIPHMGTAALRARRHLAWRAFTLRTVEGLEIRQIADELGVCKSVVGRWLVGIPRLTATADELDADRWHRETCGALHAAGLYPFPTI